MTEAVVLDVGSTSGTGKSGGGSGATRGNVAAPGGHGHTYNEELIPLWRAILGFDRLFDEVPTHPRLAALDGSWVDEAMVRRIGIVVRANLELSDRQ